ncbi:MAG: pilus assembly FimT family protein [Gemmatimonadaceae bacterium]
MAPVRTTAPGPEWAAVWRNQQPRREARRARDVDSWVNAALFGWRAQLAATTARPDATYRIAMVLPSRYSRSGFTLLELMLVLSIASVLSAVALPKVGALLDRISVRGAVNDVDALLDNARHSAMTRGERATVELDTIHAIVVLRVGRDTLRRREEGALNGVRFRASRTSVIYTQLGMGFGVSNLTLVVSRGAAAETLTVSRLGRVKR